MGTTIIRLTKKKLTAQTKLTASVVKDPNAGSRLRTAEQHRNLQGETLNNSSYLTFCSLKTIHYTIFNCFDRIWAQQNLYWVSTLRIPLIWNIFKEMVNFVVQ